MIPEDGINVLHEQLKNIPNGAKFEVTRKISEQFPDKEFWYFISTDPTKHQSLVFYFDKENG